MGVDPGVEFGGPEAHEAGAEAHVGDAALVNERVQRTERDAEAGGGLLVCQQGGVVVHGWGWFILVQWAPDCLPHGVRPPCGRRRQCDMVVWGRAMPFAPRKPIHMSKIRSKYNAAEIRRALKHPGQLCAALGVDRGGRRQASGLTILCPFHEEQTPSCSVTLGSDGTVRIHCFGCQASGDALTLVAAARGLDLSTQFARVLEEAASLAGLEPSARAEVVLEPARADPPDYTAIATALLDRCPLDSDGDVLAYAEQRLVMVEAAHAGCGGLPPLGQQAIPIARLLETFSAQSLQQADLLWAARDGRIDRSRFAYPDNRFLIPWRDMDGSIACMQRRRIDGQKATKYVFPRAFRPPLPFGAEQLRANALERTLVFVEGALDVLALRLLDRRDQLGILPLGLPGLNGWRPDWARFAKGRRVRIAFDADGAAEAKVQSVAADLYAAGAGCVERWTPRGAKDWAELVEKSADGRRRRAH